MAKEKQEQRFKLEINTDGFRPLKTYRNPQDDKIQLALQEADMRLRAQGEAAGSCDKEGFEGVTILHMGG